MLAIKSMYLILITFIGSLYFHFNLECFIERIVTKYLKIIYDLHFMLNYLHFF